MRYEDALRIIENSDWVSTNGEGLNTITGWVCVAYRHKPTWDKWWTMKSDRSNVLSGYAPTREQAVVECAIQILDRELAK